MGIIRGAITGYWNDLKELHASRFYLDQRPLAIDLGTSMCWKIRVLPRWSTG